jgi:hypothetical protein
MTPVQINDDRNRNSSLSSCYRNHEYCKKYTIQFMLPQIFIESNKVEVNAVQYQFYAHQHGDQVSPGEKTKYAYKKQGGTDKQ